jgi:hypothetical protein
MKYDLHSFILVCLFCALDGILVMKRGREERKKNDEWQIMNNVS